VATQHREEIFILSCSFQVQEEGLEHETAPPEHKSFDDTPDPRAFVALGGPTALAVYDDFLSRIDPILMRPLDMGRYLPLKPGESRPAQQMQWMKIDNELHEDPRLHAAGLAYLSDISLLDSALARHGQSIASGKFQLASLDHALWFHRPVRVDEWLLYVQDSPSAQGGRGLCRGMLYDDKGRLVASVAQEGLIRPRRKD
jgi:acyl-CoA thioesterase-2